MPNAGCFRSIHPRLRTGRPVWALVCDRDCAREMPF